MQALQVIDDKFHLFEPPFLARTRDGILDELGLVDSPYRHLITSFAYGVEVGHYPRLEEMLEQRACTVEATGDAAVMQALHRIQECVDLGLRHEREHGPGSARTMSHRFWPDVWERNERLRAAGYVLAADGGFRANAQTVP